MRANRNPKAKSEINDIDNPASLTIVCSVINTALGTMNVGSLFQPLASASQLDLRCPGGNIPNIIDLYQASKSYRFITQGILTRNPQLRLVELGVLDFVQIVTVTNHPVQTSASASFQRARDMIGVRVIQSSSSKETHIRILAQGSHTSPSDYHSQNCSIFPRSNVCTDSRGSNFALPVHLRRRLWGTPLFFSEATVCFGDYRGRGLAARMEIDS